MNQLSLFGQSGISGLDEIIEAVGALAFDSIDERVKAINEIRRAVHGVSPFSAEPVDFVEWVSCDAVEANDYNPNKVAPPEMELLRHSINHDGYTQPVVTWCSDDGRQVIDGFHRTRVCKELDDVNKRVLGYLPVVSIKSDCTGRNDRIASTIRHNRARGKHQVDSMSDIVVELKKRNWTDARISKELGMDSDEILRLCQVSGLTELFTDSDFTQAWDVGIFDSDEQVEIEVLDGAGPAEGRVFHTYDKWECHKAGFYESRPPRGMSKDEAEAAYAELLADSKRFSAVLEKVIAEWEYSCEHYLTNENMNRIAWLGQAALAYELNIPSSFRGGYHLLSEDEQAEADRVALKYLNKWLKSYGRDTVDAGSVKSKTEANLY